MNSAEKALSYLLFCLILKPCQNMILPKRIMNKKIDLFYVEAEHQYLNAQRANLLNNYTFVLARTGANFMQNRYHELIQNKHNSSICFSVNSFFDRLMLMGKILIMLINRRPKEILIGDARSFVYKIFRIYSNINGTKISLVDDGLYLLNHIKKINNHSVDIYTVLPLKVSNSRLKLNFIEPTYKFEKKGNEEKIIIVGQKIVEIGLVSRSFYEHTVTKLIEFYSGQAIVYVPHRGESQLPKALTEDTEIWSGRGAIEAYLEKIGTHNYQFVSFYSTVLVNLALANVSNCYYVKLQEKDILNKKQANMITQTQNTLREIGIKELDIWK